MTTLPSTAVAFDESAHEFVSTFLSQVASIGGHGAYRGATVARVRTLLLAAIAPGDAASPLAWSALHRAITELVATANGGHGAPSAYAYLQSFLQENIDLAASEPAEQEAETMTALLLIQFA